MPVLISMLRGVNVGGHNRIKMDALRACYESLKLKNPQSFIQSGNVIFASKECDLIRLGRRIEKGIEQTFGFRPDVILRTASELRSVIARNPFAQRSDVEPNRLLVTFLPVDPGATIRAAALKLKADPEELRMEGRELYTYFPKGMARPTLSAALLDKTLQTRGTGRNWNSVLKMLAIAEKLESG